MGAISMKLNTPILFFLTVVALLLASTPARATINDLCCDPDVNGGTCILETFPCSDLFGVSRIDIDLESPNTGATGQVEFSSSTPHVGYCFSRGGALDPSFCVGVHETG